MDVAGSFYKSAENSENVNFLLASMIIFARASKLERKQSLKKFSSEQPRSQEFFFGRGTTWPDQNVLRKLKNLKARKSHDSFDYHHKFVIFP